MLTLDYRYYHCNIQFPEYGIDPVEPKTSCSILQCVLTQINPSLLLAILESYYPFLSFL